MHFESQWQHHRHLLKVERFRDTSRWHASITWEKSLSNNKRATNTHTGTKRHKNTYICIWQAIHVHINCHLWWWWLNLFLSLSLNTHCYTHVVINVITKIRTNVISISICSLSHYLAECLCLRAVNCLWCVCMCPNIVLFI